MNWKGKQHYLRDSLNHGKSDKHSKKLRLQCIYSSVALTINVFDHQYLTLIISVCCTWIERKATSSARLIKRWKKRQTLKKVAASMYMIISMLHMNRKENIIICATHCCTPTMTPHLIIFALILLPMKCHPLMLIFHPDFVMFTVLIFCFPLTNVYIQHRCFII